MSEQVSTKAQRVAQCLRHEITTGVVPPGRRVEQRDVAARYGTSAIPVRQVLRQLAAEALWLDPDEARAVRGHLGILAALEDGPEEAAELMGAHIDDGYKTLVSYLERSHDQGDAT